MAELGLTATNRFAERRRALEARWPGAAEEIGREVGDEIAGRGREIARERITHGTGTYESSFEVAPQVEGLRLVIVVSNTAPHAPFIEVDRPPGQPVEKTYVDNAENRRRGRAGQTYIARYTTPYGMPPSGIFGDGEPDWARRFKIGRDGVPGKFIFKDLKAEFSRERLLALIAPRLRPLLTGGSGV